MESSEIALLHAPLQEVSQESDPAVESDPSRSQQSGAALSQETNPAVARALESASRLQQSDATAVSSDAREGLLHRVAADRRLQEMVVELLEARAAQVVAEAERQQLAVELEQ
eukprot:4997592-Amphidinium_carterae.1